MSPEKVPLVEKHLHEWVSDMCLCYKGICMNEAGKGALFEKHLHEWGDTQDVAESTCINGKSDFFRMTSLHRAFSNI
ncbi:TPA: hypothetical protein ACNBZU_003633 [Escherichia coli]